MSKNFIIFLIKIVILVTLKVELLKVWKFNCPELGICCQAYFKVKVSPSDQLILLSRIWEKNEKPIKNERFFYIWFFWCLASARRVCRWPRILLFEAEALRVIPSGSPWDQGAGSRPEVSKYSKWCSGKILSCAPGRLSHIFVVPGQNFNNFQFWVTPRTILSSNSDSPTISYPER